MKKKEKPSVDEPKKKLEECQKEREEYLKGWQRARADFLNYKKEEAERMKKILEYANEDLILKILPILDNFEKAEEKASNELKNNQYFEGILQVKNQLQDFLKNQGVREIESLGKKFDPNFHEAVEEVETKDKESNLVIEEIQKGYLLENRLLRPAKVKISK